VRTQAPSRGRSLKKRRAIVRQDILFDAAEYEKTGNPVHAWDAITSCLAVGLALPEWTRKYLYEAGSQITQLSRSRVPAKNWIDRAVAKALGLRAKGAHNPFRDVWRPGHELLIALEVLQCHGRHSVPPFSWGLAAVFEKVAETHHERCGDCTRKISAAKVKQCWYKHAVQFPPLFEHSNSKKRTDISR
jgi:hypothetical protein